MGKEKRGGQAGVGGQSEVLDERGEKRVHGSIVVERRGELPEKRVESAKKERKTAQIT